MPSEVRLNVEGSIEASDTGLGDTASQVIPVSRTLSVMDTTYDWDDDGLEAQIMAELEAGSASRCHLYPEEADDPGDLLDAEVAAAEEAGELQQQLDEVLEERALDQLERERLDKRQHRSIRAIPPEDLLALTDAMASNASAADPSLWHLTLVANLRRIVQTRSLDASSRLPPHVLRGGNASFDHRRGADLLVGPGGSVEDYVPFLANRNAGFIWQRLRPGALHIIPVGLWDAEEVAPQDWVLLRTRLSSLVSLEVVGLTANAVRSGVRATAERESVRRLALAAAAAPYKNPMANAEILLHEACPWDVIDQIQVYSSTAESEVRQLLTIAINRPLVELKAL